MKRLLLILLFMPVLLWSNNLIAQSQCLITITDVSCNGDCDGIASVAVTGGTPPYTYQWNDPFFQTTQHAIGLCAGTYTVTVLDANGSIICNDTATVNQPPPQVLPTITFTITPPSAPGLCDGSLTADVNGGTPPYTYLWSPIFATTPTIMGLCAGDTCCVSVSDAHGCSIMGCETIPNVISEIIDISKTTKKTLLKINNIFGQLTKRTKNELLFYIYDDGTVEKKIIIE